MAMLPSSAVHGSQYDTKYVCDIRQDMARATVHRGPACRDTLRAAIYPYTSRDINTPTRGLDSSVSPSISGTRPEARTQRLKPNY